MSEKSYVSLKQGACLVCGRPYDTGSILLDLRLRASMACHTVTGWGLRSIWYFTRKDMSLWWNVIRRRAAILVQAI